MSETKNVLTRIIQKHALEADWMTSTLVPMQGEIIIYDAEVDAQGKTLSLPSGRTTPYTHERIKVGDGKTVVKDLPFSTTLGLGAITNGEAAVAEGKYTQALTDYSHAEGYKKNTSDPSVSSGQRGFSIISTDYSDTSNYKVTLNSVEGIQKNYYFVYSTLEEAGSGLTKHLAWRPGAIPVKITAVDSSTNTITIAETLKYSKRNIEYTGDLEFSSGKAVPDRFKKGGLSNITHDLAVTTIFSLVDYDNRLASKIYFWEHPELGTSSVTKGAHAEGISTFALGDASHTEGATNLSIGDYSHTEGRENIVLVENGHAEGISTLVAPTVNYDGPGHAEGRRTTARIDSAHAEGISSNSARKIYFGSEDTWSSEGYNQLRNATVAEIKQKWLDNDRGFLMANGAAAHAEGYDTLSNGSSSHSEGRKTLAAGQASHAEGITSDALAAASHAEGNLTTAKGANTHSEGLQTTAVGTNAHAEGYSGQKLADIVTDIASVDEVDAKWEEGYPSSYAASTFGVAFGTNSHVEGRNTFAKGESSHAEGSETKAGGLAAHSEGLKTKADGYTSHAEGENTQASGRHAHAEGYQTLASGENAHSEGQGTTATSSNQHVQGKWNVEDTTNKYAHIIGGGTSDASRKNIHTVDWNGNAEFGGSVKGLNLYAGTSTLDSESIKFNISSGLSGSDVVDSVVSAKFESRRDTNTEEEVLNKTYSSLINTWRANGERLKIYDLWVASNDSPQKRVAYRGSGFMSALGRRGITLSGAHTEGCETIAVADAGSHAEGYQTAAIGNSSHAQGNGTLASGQASFAGGTNTTASNQASFAIGISAVASGQAATAIGKATTAEGTASFAGGSSSKAKHTNSFTYGEGLQTSAANQFVIGKYNANDSEALFIAGAGNSASRENVFSTGKDGQGNMFIKIGSTKLTESVVKKTLETLDSGASTWFEEKSTKGVLTIDSDVLPYVKLGKVYGKHYNIKANTRISLPDATIYETSWNETNKVVVKDNTITINAKSKAFDESISYDTGLTTPIDYNGNVRIYFLGGSGNISGVDKITVNVGGKGYRHTLQMLPGGYASPIDGENCISGLPSFPEYISFPTPYTYGGDPWVYEDVSFDIYIESDKSYEQTFMVTGFETSEGDRVDIPYTDFSNVRGYSLDKNYYDFSDGKYYQWQTYDENGQVIDLEVPIVHSSYINTPSPFLKVTPGGTITPTGDALNSPYNYSADEITWECLIQRKVGG